MLYPKENFCRQYTQDVADYVNYISDITPIRFYCYAIVFNTGEYINLTNHDEFHDLRFNEYSHMSSYIMDPGIYLMSDFNPKEIIHLGEDLGIFNAIGIFREHTNFTEVSVFALNENTKSYSSFFFNHLDFLSRFTQKFKSDFNEVITKASQTPLLFPQNLFLRKISNCYSFSSNNLLKHFIEQPAFISKLSHREHECLKLLLLGKKRKEIAEQIGISISSVGTYIKRLLAKMNLKNKSELLDYAWRSELIKSFIEL